MNLFLLMILKILSAQLYCKLDEQLKVDDQSNDSKMHFIQFQIIVDDEYQQLIKIKYENLESSEIALKYQRKTFIFDDLEIPFHGLGIWQYIFINSTNNYTNIQWYSNFVLIKEKQHKDYRKIKYVKLLQKEYIQVEFIQINSIQDTVKICNSQQQITIRFDPQLSKIQFGDFNNNMFIIAFWVKYKEFDDNKDTNDLKIQVYDKNIGDKGIFNYFSFEVRKFSTSLTSITNNIQFEQHYIRIDEWTYFNIEFNQLNRYLLFKFYYEQQFEVKKPLLSNKFISELQLQTTKSRRFLLTEIHLNLDYFNDIYRIPGCLACQYNICLQCDEDLILKDQECICKKELYFSTNECYFPDFEHFTINESFVHNQINQQKNCPQYNSQNCKTCLDQDNEWEYHFCFYSYTTSCFYEQYEFSNCNLIIVVFYQQEDDGYMIDQSMTIQNKSDIYKTDSNNYVLFHQSKYSLYQLGKYTNTNYSRIQCEENYFGKFCQPNIKNCLIQFSINICFLCKDNYYNIQQKCKRCPQNCEKCYMDSKYRIKCVKCRNKYFLGMDYKCKWCSLEYCTICYEFDNDQMSLQEISFKKNNQVKQIGCAFCKRPHNLNLKTRRCQVDSISFDKQLDFCGGHNCLYCQESICLMCESGQQNNDLESCSLDIQQRITNYKKQKQNQQFDNFWKLNTISTFLYYDYDYTHIIKNQTKYIIFDCEFPQLKNNDKEFYCLNKFKDYIGLRQNGLIKLYTFIQFNLSIYNKKLIFSNYNNLIDPQEYYSYLLQDIPYITQQIIDLKIEPGYNLSFYDQQQIFGVLYNSRIKLNHTFNNDQCLLMNVGLIIIHNSHIKVENLCISIGFKPFFDNTNILEIRNSIFEAVNQQSYLIIEQYGPRERSMVILQNVTFKNFQSEGSIQFDFQVQEAVIQNLYFHNVQSLVSFEILTEEFSLQSLEIYNERLDKNQINFIVYSYDKVVKFELQNMKIINCLFDSLVDKYLFTFDQIRDITINDILIQSSEFYSNVFYFKANFINISNLQMMNCLFRSELNMVFMFTGMNIQIYNLTLKYVQTQMNSNLIHIYEIIIKKYQQNSLSCENGYCSIQNLQFISSDFEGQGTLTIIYINAVNLKLHNVIISDGFIINLFEIDVQQSANLQNIEINTIKNIFFFESQFFLINKGWFLSIQQFFLKDSQIETQIFNFRNIRKILIDTIIIEDIAVDTDTDKQLILIVCDEIKVENMIIQNIVDKRQGNNNYFDEFRNFPLIKIQAFDVIMKFLNITNIFYFMKTFFQIETTYLKISNSQFQVLDLQILLDITSSYTDIEYVKFEQLNINLLIFVQKSQEIRLSQIQINQSEINNITFYLTDCQEINIDNIYLYPQTKVSNLFIFESEHVYQQITINQVTAKEIYVKNSLLGLSNSKKLQLFLMSNCSIYFIGQEKINSLMIFNKTIIGFYYVVIRGIKTNQLSLSGSIIYLVNFTILDSQINSIVFDMQGKSSMNILPYTFCIIDFILHNNNWVSLPQQSTPFITVHSSSDNPVVMHNIKIINSQFINDKLLQFDSQYLIRFSEIYLINNKCQNQCENFYGRNNNSNYIYNESANIQSNNNQSLNKSLKIKINNQLFNQQKLLYLPSGQSIKHYKILDLITGQSIPYIYQIELISMLNQQEQRVIGNFNIIAYRYQIQDNITSNLTDNILNFYNFSQKDSYNQLMELNLIHNPYQDDFSILLEISDQQGSFEKLSLHIKTFICQIGEIFNQDRCQKCDTNYKLYSLKQKSNLCSVFDNQIATDFQHNSIKLREGYWRPFIYSHIIEKCNIRYDRCVGGWQTGNQLCKIGYYGGLCDSCDANNIIGNGYYQMIDNQCKICDNMFKNGQFLIIKLLIIIIIYQVKLYFKSQNTKALYSRYLLQKLIFHQHFQRINIYLIDLSSIILDILIQNISITQQILKNQDFNLPEFLGIFTNPIQIVNNSTFCFSQYFGIEQYQLTLIFAFLFPFIIYNTFISLSYLIDGYVLSDLGVRYFTQSHQQFMNYFISPIIISFGMIIPLILLNQIHQSTKRIFKKKIFQTFGSFIFQYNIKFEIILNYYLTSLLLALIQINQIMIVTPKDVIPIIVFIFALKQTYKIQKFNKLLLKSWICIGLVTYITKFEELFMNPFIIYMSMSSFIIIYLFFQYIMQLIVAYDKQLLEFIQLRRKLSSYFITKILYNEKQYWKLINQLVKLHKIQFVQYKQSNERVISQTVLKQYGQNYQNLRTLKTEINEGIEMQQF